MLPQRWVWARLLSPTPLALLKWQLLRNSPAATAISNPTCAVPLRRFDCLPDLETGESRIIVTNRQDVCDVQVKKGAVVCKVASAGDVCSICREEVMGKPILYMSGEPNDSVFHEDEFTLCNPCVLAMFKQLAKTQRRFDRKQSSEPQSSADSALPLLTIPTLV